MRRWLYLCLLLIYFNILFGAPALVHAAPPQQPELAFPQLENQSSQPLALCDIFTERTTAELVLDLHERIDLRLGAHRQFSAPPGHHQLLVGNCEQDILAQQQSLLIPDLYVLSLYAQESPKSPFAQPAPPPSGSVVLEITNQAEQTICDVYISSVTAADWGEDRLGEDVIAPEDTRHFSFAPGDYDVLLKDCDDSMLLDKRNLRISRDHELTLRQVDVSITTCDVHNQQGTEAYHGGRYREALAVFEIALICFREVGGRSGAGTALNNIAVVYESQGRYAEALQAYDQALVIRREVSDRAGEATTLNNIAAVYNRQGRYAEALQVYEHALAIAQEVGDSTGEGSVLNNIGWVYDRQDRYTEALQAYEQALTIAQEVGNRAGAGTTLNNIAAVYDSQGRYAEALQAYEQALVIRRETGDRAGEATTLNNIGWVYNRQGRYTEALQAYEQALAIAQEIGNRAGAGVTFNNIGWIYDRQGRYIEALQAYTNGIETLESIRNVAGSDQARMSFATEYAEAYDRVIALQHRQGMVEQAFWYSERGRARVLLDAMATGQLQLRDNEAAALLAEEQQAYAVRQAAQDELAKARTTKPPDPAWVAEAVANLKAAEAAYEQVAAAIIRHSDQLASLLPGRQQVLQLMEVQALLDADTTLLSYWTLEDSTLAFVVTAQDATIVELPGVTAQNILAMTENLYQWRNLDNPYPAPLRQLYKGLIAPLVDKLTTPHLAIIPHQSLHYVPFAALVNSASNKRYLGEQYTLSVLPSANLLPYLQQNAAAAQANRNGDAVVFGDPATSQPDLPRLHYAASEASAVAALLHTAVLSDTDAREAILHQAVDSARIVHLAAHGAYNEANALYSAIYLAPSSLFTPTQPITTTDELPVVDTALDGRLEAHEIFGLSLHGNDLVVLSACQTNVGALSRGDELIGLTRAFFFAGSSTVISSLWSVDDAATEALMVSFYQHWLQDGMSKAEALQAAQADVRANSRWASPFYWAGFVLNGDPGSSWTQNSAVTKAIVSVSINSKSINSK
jgi:CHAT domain-containing protein/tetratricopeptide (TPR) repeat protein